MIRSNYLVMLQNVWHEGERRTISVRKSIKFAADLCVSSRIALSFLDHQIFLRYTIIAQHRRHADRTGSTVYLSSLSLSRFCVFDQTESKKVFGNSEFCFGQEEDKLKQRSDFVLKSFNDDQCLFYYFFDRF